MRTVSALLCLLAALAAAPAASCAQDVEIPRQQHAWARFAPGSWKLVRILTESYDASGRMTGTTSTETRTTLKAVGADSFTLLVESTIEVAGKKIVAEPKTLTQRYNGALAGQTAEVKTLGSETLTIEGKTYTCRVQQFEVTGTSSKTVTKTHYCVTAAPYVLRRESKTIDPASNLVTGHTLVEVTALDVPEMVLGQTHSTAQVSVMQKHAKGSETTTAVSSLEVPGGVVSHQSKELDAGGNLLSQSKLELIDYHVAQEAKAPEQSRRELRTRQTFWHRSGEAFFQRAVWSWNRHYRRGPTCDR